MFLSQKHIPRRTFLRGAGVTLALPFLESMLPAQSLLSRTAAPQMRTAFFYMMHGAIMQNWTPAQTGPNFELSPHPKPLEPFRDRLLVVSGLEAETAGPAPGESGGDHVRSAAAFLSGARAKHTAGADVYLGTTIDQVFARKIGQDTALLHSNWESRTSGTPASATTVTAAPMSTRLRGRLRPSRSLWKSTRKPCSNVCSATATIRVSGSPQEAGWHHSGFDCPRRRRRPQNARTERSSQTRRLSRRRARDRTPCSTGRQGGFRFA